MLHSIQSSFGCWKCLHQWCLTSFAYFLAECTLQFHFQRVTYSFALYRLYTYQFLLRSFSRRTPEQTATHILYTTKPRSVTLHHSLCSAFTQGPSLSLWDLFPPANSWFHHTRLNNNLAGFLYFFQLQMGTVRFFLFLRHFDTSWSKSARQEADTVMLHNPGPISIHSNSNSPQNNVLKIIYNFKEPNDSTPLLRRKRSSGAGAQVEVLLSFSTTNAIKHKDFSLCNKTIRCGDASPINWLHLTALSLYSTDLSLQHYTFLWCKCRAPPSSFHEDFSATFCCSPLIDVALKISNFNKTQRKSLSRYTSKPGSTDLQTHCNLPVWLFSSSSPKATNVKQVVFADDLDVFTFGSTCTQVLTCRWVHSQSASSSPAGVEDFLHRRVAMS